jgi:transcriptional adapter 2-alpha
MPLRGDFDVEYDNDAELLLAEMEFNGKSILLKFKLKKNYFVNFYLDDETAEEYELKMKIFEIYNARLDERISRKQFVIERKSLFLF